MRSPVPPRSRILLHATLLAAWLGGCAVDPPATPGPSGVPSPTEASPAASEPPASPSPSPTPAQPSAVLIYGDEVAAGAFSQLDDWAGAFAPAPAPALQSRGTAGLLSKDAEAQIRDVLREFPDAKRVGLALGTADVRAGRNDVPAFTVSMLSVARAIQADGREPLFARIPWSPLVAMAPAPAYNLALGAIDAELGLAPGPDLYGWFAEHPDQLGTDGLTPTEAGQAAIRRLWADALRRDEPPPAPTARPPITPTPSVFLVVGDSITYEAFLAPAAWRDLFPAGAAPAVRNFGVPRQTSAGAMAKFDQALALNPDAGLVGIALGTNDITASIDPVAFEANLRTMTTRVLEAGRVPILARIAWRTRPPLPAIPAYNARITEVEREFQLAPGPDFYAWFEAHRDEIEDDGIHPAPAGEASIRRLWAEAIARVR